MSTEIINNLLRVAQLINDRARIQTYIVVALFFEKRIQACFTSVDLIM